MNKTKFTTHYFKRDGGWYKVMRNGQCVTDFRTMKEAQDFISTEQSSYEPPDPPGFEGGFAANH